MRRAALRILTPLRSKGERRKRLLNPECRLRAFRLSSEKIKFEYKKLDFGLSLPVPGLAYSCDIL